ncbi:cadherin EGF LAG seven-pass G-type receptor 1 [Anopheles ziemanni]|uniref:cadherin EGF LAG seven-pass G-type receptor 1 n=1 Tax=Anopheles coustani TaxID=139045 RepID=UPI0026598683|nr:cadherin EGF LAG seven-pass G-type receptor 1 [Anopheles coustani]XP_058175231.1 cadherin EGF LAG seven-pass G-type receptor 1 [Anopheles ziemanni]
MVLKFTLSVLHCCLLFIHVYGQLLDNRCYLDGGGSAVNFFANEDIAVGSVVGSLRVLGDPGKDIVLTLREKDSPVYIAPGTKDLIVAKPLDKEGLIGPSAVFVNVICERKFSDDAGIIIPVNIRVTDVNDNAPIWIGAPYKLNLSEVTVIGTRILQGIRAHDLDQPGPYSTVEYQTLPGPYSEYVAFVTPLEGTLVLKKYIDYETVQNFTVKIRAQDQGKPPKYSDTYVTIRVLDSDDQNPKFARDVYYGQLPDEKGDIAVTPERIRAEDQDRGIRADIRYSIVSSNGSEDDGGFEIHPISGTIRMTRTLASGQVPHSRTIVVKATQVDNPDRYALTTVVLSPPKVAGTSLSDISVQQQQQQQLPGKIEGAAFVRGTFYATVREDANPGAKIAQLPGGGDGRLRYTIVGPSVAQEQFRVGPGGEIVLAKPLTYRRTPQYGFTVDSIDAPGGRNHTTNVVIDVLPANMWEPRFRKPFYSFVIESPQHAQQQLPQLVGRIEAADGDRTDELSFVLKGNYSNLFRVDPYGNLWLVSNRTDLPLAMRLLATVTDSGTPQKSATVPVVVKLRPETASLTSNLLIVNIVVACLLGVLLVGGLVRCVYRRRKRKVSSAEQIVGHASGVPPLKNQASSNRFLLQRAEQRMLERPTLSSGGRLTDCAASSTLGSDNQDFMDNERETARRTHTQNTRALEQEELAGQNLNHLLLHWQEKYEEKNNCTEDMSVDDKLIVYF